MKKRRFYEGGPTEDEDKATGLAASKGEDVGFFKRLSMGNIDKPDSEAGQQFGAGRARLDRMPAAPDRSKSMGNMEGLDVPVRPSPRPPPVTIAPTPTGDLGEIKDEAGTVSRFRRNTETGEAYDPGSATDKKPVATKKPGVKPVAKPTVNPRDAEKGMSRGRPAITGEIANLDSRAVRDRKTAQMMMAQDEKLRKKRAAERLGMDTSGMKKGGGVKAYASGGSVSSRADGCAQRGKTRGMMR